MTVADPIFMLQQQDPPSVVVLPDDDDDDEEERWHITAESLLLNENSGDVASIDWCGKDIP